MTFDPNTPADEAELLNDSSGGAKQEMHDNDAPGYTEQDLED